MNRVDIERQMREIVARDGPWSAHKIHLGDGLSTIGPRDIGHDLLLRRITQIVADVVRRPLAELRVLDLACLEGLYGIELARQGATVVGIEGREVSVRKARFAAEALGLSNITFHQGDVRDLSKDRYGEFDVVLCVGILYHLDAPAVFDFVHRVSQVCKHLAVLHTHISLSPRVAYQHDGRTYHGHSMLEHLSEDTTEQRERALWGSLDNPRSVWMTRASLYNLLVDAGFTSVLDCRVPYVPMQFDDHVTLAAIKGKRIQIECVPELNEFGHAPWPERRAPHIHPAQKWYYDLARRYGRFVPGKHVLKRLLGLDWHSPNRKKD